MKLKILDRRDLEQESRWSVLYQGPPKTGKTHAALTWPKPLVVYFDPNLSTPRRLLPPDGAIVVPESAKEFEMDVLPELLSSDLPYETVVVDSYSFFAGKIVDELSLGGRKRMEFQDWGTLLTRLNNTMDHLHQLTRPRRGKKPYHLVVTVHEQVNADDSGAVVNITPSIPGQFKDRIQKWFDLVLLTAVEVVREAKSGKADYRAEYYVWTVPPDRAHVGIGGISKLPARMSGTYDALIGALREENS